MTKDAWQRFGDSGHKHYHVVDAGFKYNMMDLQAAIGIHQLKRVEQSWNKRQAIWSRYQQDFSGLPIGTPAEPAPDTRHAYHLYTLTIDRESCGRSRDEFVDAMIRANIGVGVHYLSLAQHPFYQDRFGWQPEDFPVAERYGLSTVSLPLSAKLIEAEIDRINTTVARLVEG